MLDHSIEIEIKQLVDSAYKRGEVVNVYRLAQLIPASHDGCTSEEVAARVTEMAVRMGASVCWERQVFEQDKN